jgi:hypothetical protein
MFEVGKEYYWAAYENSPYHTFKIIAMGDRIGIAKYIKSGTEISVDQNDFWSARVANSDRPVEAVRYVNIYEGKHTFDGGVFYPSAQAADVGALARTKRIGRVKVTIPLVERFDD